MYLLIRLANYVMNKINFRDHYYSCFQSEFSRQFETKIFDQPDLRDYVFLTSLFDCFVFDLFYAKS